MRGEHGLVAELGQSRDGEQDLVLATPPGLRRVHVQ
jgi:hypothetical protein